MRGSTYWAEGSPDDARTAFVRVPFVHAGGRVHLQQQWVSGLDEFNFTEVDRRIYHADVIVFGIGAFIPSGQLHETLRKWHAHFQQSKVCARFVWLEYFAGHFPTPPASTRAVSAGLTAVGSMAKCPTPPTPARPALTDRPRRSAQPSTTCQEPAGASASWWAMTWRGAPA